MGTIRRPQFIVCSYPRTGTTLLMAALGQHPQLTQCMEVLHEKMPLHDPEGRWRESVFQELYGKTQAEMATIGEFGEPRLDYCRYDLRPFIRKVAEEYNGFKLLYHQIPPDSSIWEPVVREIRPKIIYLERSLLETALSIRLVYLTNIWQKYDKNQVIEDDIRLPVESNRYGLGWFYSRFCTRHKTYHLLFSSLDSITITYTELTQDWEKTIARVEAFLGVDQVPLPQVIFKRTTKPMSEVYYNMQEFEEHRWPMSYWDYARVYGYLFL